MITQVQNTVKVYSGPQSVGQISQASQFQVSRLICTDRNLIPDDHRPRAYLADAKIRRRLNIYSNIEQTAHCDYERPRRKAERPDDSHLKNLLLGH